MLSVFYLGKGFRINHPCVRCALKVYHWSWGKHGTYLAHFSYALKIDSNSSILRPGPEFLKIRKSKVWLMSAI